MSPHEVIHISDISTIVLHSVTVGYYRVRCSFKIPAIQKFHLDESSTTCQVLALSFRESPGQCLLYAESRDSQAYDFTMKVQNKVLHVFGYVVVQIIQPILIIDLKDTKGKYKVVQVQHKSKCENSEWLEEGVVDFEGKIGWEEISVWLEGE